MKKQVEEELGFEVTEEQFQQSEERSRKKLDSIISRFGDAGGARRTPEYLIELIYEDIIMDAFSKATLFVAQSMLDMEKEHSVKNQSTLTEQPYCSMTL